VVEGNSPAQASNIKVTRTKNLEPATEKKSLADLDETDRQRRLRNKEIMILELGKDHQREFQRRGLSPSQEHLPAPIYTERSSSESQYSADHDDRVEDIRLQARFANKARNREEILKEIERLGLTEQITLSPLEAATPTTSLSPASKEKSSASPNAQDAQGGRKKLRKKRGLPLLAPKPEAPAENGFSDPAPDQRRKDELGVKAKGAFQRLKRTFSPQLRPSTPFITAPTGQDPSVMDTQRKIELARGAGRNLVAAAKYYEAPPRSSSLQPPSSREFSATTSMPADMDMEISKEAQKNLEVANAYDATSSDTSEALPLSSTRSEISVSEIDMKLETRKKIELAREAEWEKAHGTLPDGSSAYPTTLPAENSEYGLHSLEFDHVSDTRKKIELAREVRRRLEEEEAKGISPALSSTPMLACKHWLRCDLCRICGESEVDEGKE
jgi:hypothetical protein